MNYYCKIENGIVYTAGSTSLKIPEADDTIMLTKDEYSNIIPPCKLLIDLEGKTTFEPIAEQIEKREFKVYFSGFEKAVLNLADVQLAVSMIEPLDAGANLIEISNKINELLKILGGE